MTSRTMNRTDNNSWIMTVKSAFLDESPAFRKRTPRLWKRVVRAYRYKKFTDQNFFATVVALQVSAAILFVIVVVFFMTRGSTLNYSLLSANLP
jgi:hypothetical protein